MTVCSSRVRNVIVSAYATSMSCISVIITCRRSYNRYVVVTCRYYVCIVSMTAVAADVYGVTVSIVGMLYSGRGIAVRCAIVGKLDLRVFGNNLDSLKVREVTAIGGDENSVGYPRASIIVVLCISPIRSRLAVVSCGVVNICGICSVYAVLIDRILECITGTERSTVSVERELNVVSIFGNGYAIISGYVVCSLSFRICIKCICSGNKILIAKNVVEVDAVSSVLVAGSEYDV